MDVDLKGIYIFNIKSGWWSGIILSIELKVSWAILSFNKRHDKRWYVFSRNECGKNALYLHKDMTISKSCGRENFWDTEEEAYDAIKLYHQIGHGIDDFISEEEMEL